MKVFHGLGRRLRPARVRRGHRQLRRRPPRPPPAPRDGPGPARRRTGRRRSRSPSSPTRCGCCAPSWRRPLLTPLPRKLELLEEAGIDAAVVQPFDLAYAATPAAELRGARPVRRAWAPPTWWWATTSRPVTSGPGSTRCGRCCSARGIGLLGDPAGHRRRPDRLLHQGPGVPAGGERRGGGAAARPAPRRGRRGWCAGPGAGAASASPPPTCARRGSSRPWASTRSGPGSAWGCARRGVPRRRGADLRRGLQRRGEAHRRGVRPGRRSRPTSSTTTGATSTGSAVRVEFVGAHPRPSGASRRSTRCGPRSPLDAERGPGRCWRAPGIADPDAPKTARIPGACARPFLDRSRKRGATRRISSSPLDPGGE